MVQYGFYYDNSRCTGCKTCVMACKDYKDSALDVAYRKVYDLEGGTWERRNESLHELEALDLGWRLGVAEEPQASTS